MLIFLLTFTDAVCFRFNSLMSSLCVNFSNTFLCCFYWQTKRVVCPFPMQTWSSTSTSLQIWGSCFRCVNFEGVFILSKATNFFANRIQPTWKCLSLGGHACFNFSTACWVTPCTLMLGLTERVVTKHSDRESWEWTMDLIFIFQLGKLRPSSFEVNWLVVQQWWAMKVETRCTSKTLK